MDFLREQGSTVVQLDVEDKGFLAKTLLVSSYSHKNRLSCACLEKKILQLLE